MPAFDADRYVAIQSGAVGLAARINALIGDMLARGADRVFFLGSGGAAILMQPALQLLQQRSGIHAHTAVSAELVLTGHAQMGPEAIVVIPSLSGTAGESIAAMECCQAQGAQVISLVLLAAALERVSAHLEVLRTIL